MKKHTPTYEYLGQSYTLKELWAIAQKKSGITLKAFSKRLISGWSPKDAVEKPPRTRVQKHCVQYSYHGKTMTLNELSEMVGKSALAIRNDLVKGKPLEEAVKTTYPKYIFFDRPVNGVTTEMQPMLNRIYRTRNGYWPLGPTKDQWSIRYCVILLENQQKLLVYEGEFNAVTDLDMIAQLDEMAEIEWEIYHQDAAHPDSSEEKGD